MNFDVCILGGGLAGQLLARQLRRYLPHLSIALFEKEPGATYKVGESTVEIAGDYLVRKLGLSSYLYNRQLPKNGLRFFFDSPARDMDLEEMSEIGGVRLRGRAAFQLDRMRLEADLRELNENNGVALFTGHKVTGVAIGDFGSATQRHRVVVNNGEGERQIACRWIVDATGRHSLIARAVKSRIQEPKHHCMAVWGRFRDVADLDDWGPTAFRERVNYTSRVLSTTHFSYPGYWIWFIPLEYGVTSVGVVIDRNFLPRRGLGTHQGFLEFLNEHRAVAELLRTAKLEAVGSLGRLAYNSTRYFSPARWGLTGEAAAFSDPLYSPGSDFIALANDFLTNLIEADYQGAGPDALARRANLFDAYLHFRHEAAMRLYRGLYSTLGSFEIFRAKWSFDLPLYYHWWLSEFLQDLHLDESFVEERLANQSTVLSVLDKFSHFFQRLVVQLSHEGNYHRHNRGDFMDDLADIDFLDRIGRPQSTRYQYEKLCEILNKTRRLGLECLKDRLPGSLEPLSLGDLLQEGNALYDERI